ncbi:hypothetical protein YC2023_021145 [Brassica napus]
MDSVSSLSPRKSSPRYRSPPLSKLHFHVIWILSKCAFSAANRRLLHIACARGTDQEDDLSSSSSEKEKIDLLPHKDEDEGLRDNNNNRQEETNKTSFSTVALCVSTAVAFGIGIGFKEGVGKASEFFAGYLLEQSLSVDNLFVFVLVFKYFKVPLMYQNRVLTYGVAGAILFRFSLIVLGTATLQRFEAVNLLLAAVLLYSSFKATPLLLTVAVIELSDIAFAVDSIPAVFGVTRDPFIVLTSNLFAIIGLRSLYTLISEGMGELEYLQPSIAVVLGFIGFKMILDFFGFHVSTEASLGVVALSLSTGVLLSLTNKSGDS